MVPSSRFPGERKVIVCNCTDVETADSVSVSLEIVRVKSSGVKNWRYGVGSSEYFALLDRQLVTGNDGGLALGGGVVGRNGFANGRKEVRDFERGIEGVAG